MAGSVVYMMTRVSMAELEAMRDKDRHAIVVGIPGFYALDDTGGIHTYPAFDVTQGYLDRDDEVNQVCYVPGQRIDAFKKAAEAVPCPGCAWGHGAAHVRGCPNAFRDYAAQPAMKTLLDKATEAVAAAQRKEHPAQKSPSQIYAEGEHVLHNFNAVPCNTRPGTLVGSSPDPIVDMIEFKGRLYVATTRGVFVKTDDDKFVELSLYEYEASKPQEGRAADEAAGLVPLHPNQTTERADPFVPNHFGEHG